MSSIETVAGEQEHNTRRANSTSESIGSTGDRDYTEWNRELDSDLEAATVEIEKMAMEMRLAAQTERHERHRSTDSNASWPSSVSAGGGDAAATSGLFHNMTNLSYTRADPAAGGDPLSTSPSLSDRDRSPRASPVRGGSGGADSSSQSSFSIVGGASGASGTSGASGHTAQGFETFRDSLLASTAGYGSRSGSGSGGEAPPGSYGSRTGSTGDVHAGAFGSRSGSSGDVPPVTQFGHGQEIYQPNQPSMVPRRYSTTPDDGSWGAPAAAVAGSGPVPAPSGYVVSGEEDALIRRRARARYHETVFAMLRNCRNAEGGAEALGRQVEALCAEIPPEEWSRLMFISLLDDDAGRAVMEQAATTLGEAVAIAARQEQLRLAQRGAPGSFGGSGAAGGPKKSLEKLTPEQRRALAENKMCFRCRRAGHFAKDCPFGEKARRSAASQTQPQSQPPGQLQSQ